MNRRTSSLLGNTWALPLALGALSAFGCTSGSVKAGDPRSSAAGRVSQALSTDGGDFTVTGPGTVVNRYARLAADALKGSSALKLDSADVVTALNVAPGDYLMIIQMQGAVFKTGDDATYGAVTNLGGAGLYEQVLVKGTSNDTVNIDPGCGGLKNTYLTAGHAQVVRVARYKALSIGFGGVLTTPAWDGNIGGVVAVRADNLTVSGRIDATGTGFRGGNANNVSGDGAADQPTYRGTSDGTVSVGAEKGEGIGGSGGYGGNYDALGGSYGRGAPANGGGGGNSHKAGGGGGANAGDLGMWTGQGVMNAGVPGAAAWALDPGYKTNGNTLTTSTGGGRGGYTYSANLKDATTVAPGDASWGGNSRRERGGLGGRPVQNDYRNRLYLGGGGGAGDANAIGGPGGRGGRGGGLLYLWTGGLQGGGEGGSIAADGENGQGVGNVLMASAEGEAGVGDGEGVGVGVGTGVAAGPPGRAAVARAARWCWSPPTSARSTSRPSAARAAVR